MLNHGCAMKQGSLAALYRIHRMKLLVAVVGLALLIGLNRVAHAARLTPSAVAKVAELAAQRVSYDRAETRL
jgi:hypothetical protein